jgi:diaminohydroxyphosphoribosylaminopyrimidine deaminase/5-amino-6-(5-phosphoribosylamino)uracil reductase
MEIDRQMMDRALDAADAGYGRVHPNPLVGAVIAKDGEVIATGHHSHFGGTHAEAAALAVR